MTTLLYVADPMCSWCYGFAPVLAELRSRLREGIRIEYVMGGLAPDSDAPMPDATRAYVRQAWHAVAARTGAEFNHDFWEVCVPRRSTYPACRAVIAAGRQREGAEAEMFAAIQRAYYREARNPSDTDVLVALAGELTPALDADRFAGDLRSGEVRATLDAHLERARTLGVTGFPSVVLTRGPIPSIVCAGYGDADDVIESLLRLEPGSVV